jgi:hypothetical protein
VVRVRTTSSCATVPVTVLIALLAAPVAVDARADQAQTFPSEERWTIAFKERPVAAPVASAERIFVARQNVVSAHTLLKGDVLWTTKITADGPLVATAERVLVPSAGSVTALDASTGAEVWKLPVEGITAPMVAHGDFVFIAAAEHLAAYSVADGSIAWTTAGWAKSLGVVEERSAINANWLYVPVADGRIVALDLSTGVRIWETDRIGIKPAQPTVAGDRLFAGSEAKRFCSFRTTDGERLWCQDEIGAPTVGAPAVDASRVYIVALDNQIWVFDRRDGGREWKKDLGYRPSAGPAIVGTTVSAPGKTKKVIAFDVATRKEAAHLAVSEDLVFPTVFIPPSEGLPLRVAVLYGGLNNEWKLTLAGPPPPALPSITVEPLTTLPGRVVRLPAGRAPRE